MGPCCSKVRPTSIETRSTVPCAAGDAYRVLTNFDEFPQWNTSFRIVGSPTPGSQLNVHFLEKDMTFTPIVLTADPRAAEFRWRGQLCCEGCFDGEHYFRLEPIVTSTGGMTNGSTTFVHGETFSGCLVCCTHPCIGCLLLDDTKSGFEKFNASFTTRCARSML